MKKVIMFSSIFVVSFLITYFVICLKNNKTEKRNIINDISSSSVLIYSDGGFGSGVVFKNGEDTFVWTDAHVVAGAQEVFISVDLLTGVPKIYVTYKDVFVVQEMYEQGRKVGETRHIAKIIRYSQTHDIALLQIYKKNAFASSVEFISNNEIPNIGDKLWHVGSMTGPKGANSLSEGIFSKAGRLRKYFVSDELVGIIYDQCSLSAHRGSSGGGVFRQSDGKCIGIVTEFLGKDTYGEFCITPARRLREFAKYASCEWAMNHIIKVPQTDETCVTQDVLILTDELKIILFNKEIEQLPQPREQKE